MKNFPHTPLKNKKYCFKVDVTEKDIKKGRQGSPYHCPVALAIRRAINRTDNIYVAVTQMEIEVTSEKFNITVTLPKKIQNFVERFDEGSKKVKPTSFVLRFEVQV